MPKTVNGSITSADNARRPYRFLRRFSIALIATAVAAMSQPALATPPVATKSGSQKDAQAPKTAAQGTPNSVQKGPLPALPASAQQTLSTLPGDSPDTVNSTHYVTSNENRHEYFRTALAGVSGGAYVGIAADQNYMLIGWSRPEIAILTDFDSHVVNVHAVYKAFFAHAKTPFRFRLLWTRGYRAEGRKAIAAFYPDKAQRRRVFDTFDYTKKRVAKRISWLRNHLRTKRIPSVYTDQSDYDFVRNLVRTGRVHAVVADMTGKTALAGVAKALKTLKVTVQTLFLSNAEYYFPYGPQVRKNILGLPLSSNSQVLRTRSLGRGVYEYYAQRGSDMRLFLQAPETKDVLDILGHRKATTVKHRYDIGGPASPKVVVERRRNAAKPPAPKKQHKR